MKVYVIRYEELCSGVYSSGISYVLDSKEKAEVKLEEIKDYEIEYYKDNGVDYIENIIKKDQNAFIIDFSEDYTKYEIKEIEVL